MLPKASITFNHVYSVTISRENEKDEVSLAIRPTFHKNNRVIWEDTGRGRIVDYLKKGDVNINIDDYLTEKFSGEKSPKRITIIDNENHTKYTLDLLTVKLYDEKVKNSVADHPTFTSDNKIQKHFLDTPFGY